MGLLQLMVGKILATGAFSAPVRRTSAWLTGSGSLVYTFGYALALQWPISIWLAPAGALLNLAAFILLTWAEFGARENQELSVLLAVLCLGMLLDLTMGLFAANPKVFFPAYIGPEDGVRLRMLRLARAAVIALSLLTLLYEGVASRADAQRWAVRWGRIGMFLGTILMPMILIAASLTSVPLKFLLAIPANAVFAGTLVGLWLATRHACRLELWGWLLIAPSLAVGLAMGMYAFGGPLPSPAFLGAYNDIGRRLVRLGHAYLIILGLLSILVSRELDRLYHLGWLERIGRPLLVVGGATTVVSILLYGVMDLQIRALSVGPALVVIATVLCIGPVEAKAWRD
jgi:hypothetical protein